MDQVFAMQQRFPAGEGSVQEALNMLRATLFGDSTNLSGAVKDEPIRLLVADKLNALERALDQVMLDALDALDNDHEAALTRCKAANRRLADDHQVQLDRATFAEAVLSEIAEAGVAGTDLVDPLPGVKKLADLARAYFDVNGPEEPVTTQICPFCGGIGRDENACFYCSDCHGSGSIPIPPEEEE